nr:MAG TPA: hypothetical protein [Caudoviricetes sp.]DAX42212.1 MAG TPA: hypothetical protein [Caudoviricetes sp.]
MITSFQNIPKYTKLVYIFLLLVSLLFLIYQYL